MKRFDKKNILITGGTSGLGEAVVMAFAAEGGTVYFCGLDDKDGARVVKAVEALGAKAYYEKCDVRVAEDVKNFVANAQKAMGCIDIAINNAGISHTSNKMADIPLDTMDDVWKTNVAGVWHAMRYTIPLMVHHKSGVIINIASVLSRSGAGWMAAYGMSKHAVIGLTKSASMDYADAGLRINAISPGPIDTPMFARAMEDIAGDTSKYAGGLPENGPADPADIAKTILYVASEDAAYMNGANVILDGGVSMGVRQ